MKNKSITILIIITISGIIISGLGNINSPEKVFTTNSPLGIPYSLIISNNNDLFSMADQNNWTGVGTINDPILIKGIILIGSDQTSEKPIGLIVINNTDKYINIENCILDGRHVTEYGIFLNNVSKISIINNTILNVNKGINLAHSHVMIIDYNVIFGNSDVGIEGNFLANINITRNSIKDSYKGVMLFGTDNITISRNYIHSNSYAIYLFYADFTDVYLNDFSFNWHVIWLAASATSNNISNNNIEENNGVGAYISDNVFTSKNIFKYNNFIRNGLRARPSGMQDDGGETRVEYNYWDEWNKPDENGDNIVDTPFLIYGSAGTIDNTPVMIPYSISEELKETAVVYSTDVEYFVSENSETSVKDPSSTTFDFSKEEIENFTSEGFSLDVDMILVGILGLGIVTVIGVGYITRSRNNQSLSQRNQISDALRIEGRSMGFCYDCSGIIEQNDKYCANCGIKLR